jgi:sialic acid synthase SpsE
MKHKKNHKTPIFIAEIGMNYNNNFDLNFELIKQAKLSGATFAKFQLGWRDGEGEINQLNKNKIRSLYEWGNYFEIEILFSIISEKAFAIIKDFKPKYFKIASRTVVDNQDLVKSILDLGATTFCSLGMSENVSPPYYLKKYKNLKYFWCKSKYPCEPKDMIDLPKNFFNTIYSGYSDHTIGIETCLIALSRGASIIEKHFSLDKSENIIRDHALSATPDEFRIMVNLGTDIFRKINLGV